MATIAGGDGEGPAVDEQRRPIAAAVIGMTRVFITIGSSKTFGVERPMTESRQSDKGGETGF